MCLFGGITLTAAEAETRDAGPEFQEVYDLIRTHLTGVSAPELNGTAVRALVSALSPRVQLLGPEDKSTEAGGPLIKKSSLFEGGIAYVRIGRVEEGLANAVREAFAQSGTNKPTGTVLDLRFAGGEDYAAAAATADLFVSKEKPLLDWGKGPVRSKAKSDAITVPVAVLVNGETTRAAEALAGALREAGAGLILGNKTAGQAAIAQDFPLKNGQRLRIAATPVRVGESTELSAKGVKPDIAVAVTPEDERAYFVDAFKDPPGTNSLSASLASDNGTNRTRRARFGEAELVRERREGLGTEIIISGRAEPEADKPVVRDPVLARALDVLKGLAVVRKTRS